MKYEKIINELQCKLENINLIDFYIIRFDRSGKLLLAGSFDFCYHHDMEIIFEEVSFICCPTTNFSINRIRMAKESEIISLNKMYDIDKDGYVIAMEDTMLNAIYYIVSEKIDYNFQVVKYYNNEGKEIKGEVISDWAKDKLSI